MNNAKTAAKTAKSPAAERRVTEDRQEELALASIRATASYARAHRLVRDKSAPAIASKCARKLNKDPATFGTPAGESYFTGADVLSLLARHGMEL